MRRRTTSGLGALAVLAVFFLAAPVALAASAGWPVPSADSLRAAIELHYLPAHLVGQLGATAAWAAWAWLAVASARMGIDAWADRPARHALGTGWLRPLVVQAVGGLVVLSGAASRTPAWGATPHQPTEAHHPRPAATQPAHHREPSQRVLQPPRPHTTNFEDGETGRHNHQPPAKPVGAPAGSNQSTAPAPHPSGHRYVVQPGETLWDIARDQLGDPLRWRQIWQLNQGETQPDGRRLADPGRIHPGWQLQLAAANTTTPAAAAPHPNSPPASTPVPAPTPPGRTAGNGATPSPTATVSTTSLPPSTDPAPTAPPSAGSTPAPAVEAPSPLAAPATTKRPTGPQLRGEPAHAGHGSDSALPVAVGAAGLSSAVLWLGVRRWRRRRAAKMPPGWLPASPTHQIQALGEDAIVSAHESVDRLDVALRHLGLAMETRPPGKVQVPVAVVLGDDDTVEVILDADQPGDPPAPWQAVDEHRWQLAADQPVELRPAERRAPAPCPALVTLGDTPEGAVLVNLEATGGAFLDGPTPRAESYCRRWALELSGAAWSAGVRVLAADNLDLPATMPRVETLDRPAMQARCQAAADWGAAAAGTLAGETHPHARIAARLGDELTVAVCPDGEPPPSCPGLVVIGPRPGGLRIDLAAGSGNVPGVGEVWLLAPDDTETTAALAAGTADAVPPATSAAIETTTVEPRPVAPIEEPTVEEPTVEEPTVDEPSMGPRLRLLGPVKVLGVAEQHRTQLVEMAALLALHQEGCSWETFGEVIWRDRRGAPQGPPALKTVRTRIAELRAWLGGPDTVISDGGTLRLDGDIQVDWWRFEALAARPETMSQALALVEGRPLQGVLDGWAERDYWVCSIEAAVISVALAAADAAVRRGAWDQGLAAAEVGLKLCPFDQRLTRAAMHAAAAGGDLELVHTVVARAEAQLEEDEGLDPETVELLHTLTTGSA